MNYSYLIINYTQFASLLKQLTSKGAKISVFNTDDKYDELEKDIMSGIAQIKLFNPSFL